MKRTVAILAALMMLLSTVAMADSAKTALKPGTYQGSAQGQNDLVTVAVTVSADKIEKVEVVSHQETPGIGAPLTESHAEGDTPIGVLPQRIVDAQSYAVDSVSGATITSRAIQKAVKEALKEAGAKEDEWGVKPEKAKGKAIDMTADVVVLGGGGAGLAATISAMDAGAQSVIMVEKCGAVGGDTLVCGAIYNCPDPELQSKGTLADAKRDVVEKVLAKKDGNEEVQKLRDTVTTEWEAYKKDGRTDIFDSDAWYALQTLDGGDYVGDSALVEVMAFHSKDAYDWLKAMGMGFADKIAQGAGSLWERTHTSLKPMGTGFISTYAEKVASYGDKVKLFTSTTAKELVVKDGRVVGATAVDTNGNTYTFTANKGVVLATGGFAANSKMAQEYNTSGKWKDLSKVKTTNRYHCSQGDGIVMAKAIGADLATMEQIQLLYLGNLKDGQLTKYPKRVVNGTDQEIFINKEGKRFVQEDGRRDQICLASLDQTDGMFYFLESADGTYEDIDKAVSADGFSLRFLEEQGYIYVADTLDAMAEKLNAAGANMKAEDLKETVKKFNACVEAQKDEEFGRTLLTIKLENGPWVATPRQACLHHTMGGVKIDTSCRVLNTEGQPIEGLVAAGEVTGGIHGANRLGGNAVVDTVVFGKLAGETVMAGQK